MLLASGVALALNTIRCDGDDYLDNGHDGTLRGGNGNDHIRAVAVYSGSQSDVQGGAGDDNIEAHNGVGDIIDCGDGTDTVTFDAGLDTVTNCE